MLEIVRDYVESRKIYLDACLGPWRSELMEVYQYARVDHDRMWHKLLSTHDKRQWEEMDLWIQRCNMLVREWILDNFDILSRS